LSAYLSVCQRSCLAALSWRALLRTAASALRLRGEEKNTGAEMPFRRHKNDVIPGLQKSMFFKNYFKSMINL
jgi:hypothetical protein